MPNISKQSVRRNDSDNTNANKKQQFETVEEDRRVFSAERERSNDDLLSLKEQIKSFNLHNFVSIKVQQKMEFNMKFKSNIMSPVRLKLKIKSGIMPNNNLSLTSNKAKSAPLSKQSFKERFRELINRPTGHPLWVDTSNSL